MKISIAFICMGDRFRHMNSGHGVFLSDVQL
jgi:hypothetical protein